MIPYSSLAKQIIFVIYMIFAIVFAVLAYYYYKKNKQTEKALQFEMQDVRNAASIGSTQTSSRAADLAKRQAYTSLMKDEEDEEKKLQH